MSSVGKISLDLNVNSKKFSKQVDGIQKQTTKAFGTMSVAIGNIVSQMVQKAAASIGHFVKDSINKGSELSELQNVVDSVFTTMSDKVESFSKNALAAYGLTEAQSKKMVGTFGAMSKSFGYSEKQAYDMSTALTGLAGDVASFYNLSHDEAYTKLKSVFTGETESLKELGVVMTQTALDEFALAKGFGQTTSKMSEQEKVALRLAFVQDKLSTAAGDFTRTQDQWANQTRILTGQFESFKAAIGQGFINILTPVIRMLNNLMAKLVQAGNAFKSFTEMIMGKKSSSGGGAGAVMTEVAEAAESAAGSTGGIEQATNGAASAAKKAQKALMGFDEINKLTGNADEGGSGSDSGASSSNIDFGSISGEVEEATSPVLDTALTKVKELIEILKSGFKSGLGSDFEASLERVKVHVSSIGDSLKHIFVNEEISASANNWIDTITYALGQATGSIVSIAETLVEMFVGGIDNYLVGSKDFIKQSLISIIDVSADYYEIAGNLTEAVASIFEVFRGDTAKQITGDLISIVANSYLGIIETAVKIGRDLLNCIAQPIIDNKDLIKETIEGILQPIGVIVETLGTAVKDTFEKIKQVYDEKVQPMFQSFADGISEWVSALLNAFNEHIKPVLDRLGELFKTTWESYVQPAINNMIDFVGKLADGIKLLWESILQPLIQWAIETIVPLLAPIFETIGKFFIDLFGRVAQVIGGIFETLGGLIDFIVGVFTGDWTRAWEGVQTVFSGVCSIVEGLIEGLKGIFQGLLDFIKGIVNGVLGFVESMVNGVITGLNSMINALNNLSFDVPDWVPGIGGETFGFDLSKIKSVSLPRLAEGGYVRANQPQPVIVGDNRTQGEIIAPEGKILELVLDALKTFFGQLQQSGYNTSTEAAGDIVIPVYLDGTILDEVIVTAQQRRNIRSGGR